MCGGRGTRLDADVEKPLFEVAGRRMVDRVLDALEGGRVGQVHPVVSPHAPGTREHLAAYDAIETAGEGYVADLGAALDDDRVSRPVLTVVADLPLLAPALVDLAVARYGGRPLTACVPAALREVLGVSADTTRAHGGTELVPAGLNVVAEDAGTDENVVIEDNTTVVPKYNGNVVQNDNDDVVRNDNTPAAVRRAGDEDLLVSYDARLAVNVNRLSDAAVAEVLADGP